MQNDTLIPFEDHSPDYESLAEYEVWERDHVDNVRRDSKRSTLLTSPALVRSTPTCFDDSSTLSSNPPTSDNEKAEIPSQRETADLVINEVKGLIAYHVQSGEWYTRKGNIMAVSDADAVNPFIISALDKIKYKKYTYSQVSSIKQFTRDLLRIEKFEDSRTLLPLRNGVYNLKTNQLERFDNYSFNWELPYSYDVGKKCPATLRYLITTTNGDKDLIKFLLAWMRVLIAGEYSVQKYIELVGDGGTGKSTFLELCTLLVGENNRVVTDLKSLENNRFESANLQGKKLALITDSSRYGGEVSILKAITGGDVVRNEKKNKQAGNGFVFTGLVMIASNEQIQSSDYTSGLARRKIPVIFNARVSEKEKSRYPRGIIYQMKQELPGLLNILIKIDLKDAVKLVKYPEGTLAKIKIQNELGTNPILQWMHENLIRCEDGRHSFIGKGVKQTDSVEEIKEARDTKLYPNYCGWCEEQGKHPVAINRFSGLIEDNARSRGIDTKKRRLEKGTFFKHLRLRVKYETAPLLLNHVDQTTNHVELNLDNAGNVSNVDKNQPIELSESNSEVSL